MPLDILNLSAHGVKIDNKEGSRWLYIPSRSITALWHWFNLPGPFYREFAPVITKRHVVEAPYSILCITLIFKVNESIACLHVDPADGAVLGEEALEVILAGVVVEVAAEHRPHGLRLSAASFVTAL